MQRIYYKHGSREGVVVDEKALYNQLTKVLRQRVGDEIIFFDGENLVDRIYKIDEINKKEIFFTFVAEIPKGSEESTVVLNQATPNKLDKIELILQKGVEVGVSKFIFFSSDRSQKLAISDNKMERLHKIIIEAVEQSGRNKIPQLFFEKSVKIGKNPYFFHTKSDNSVTLFDIKPFLEINLYIGPEGGFSDSEVEEFENAGASRVTLGKGILRCETAAITASFFVSQIKN